MSQLVITQPARDRGVRTASIVFALAVVAGMLAAMCDVSPTGSSGADVATTFVVAAFVAWAGASAPWWAITAAGLVAVVGTSFGPWMAPAVVATGIGAFLAFASRELEWLRVVATGCVVVALLNLRLHPFLGASAIVAGVVMLALALIGVACRESPVRARAMWLMVGALVLAVLAALGMGAGALQAKDAIESGNDLLTDGFDLLRDGDTTQSADLLRQAALKLESAAQSLDAPWTRPAELLPVVAQHRTLALNVVESAASSARVAADALASVDVDQLRLLSGKVDVSQLGELAEPFAALDSAVGELAAALDVGESPWIAGPVRDELVKVRPDIDKALVQTNAIAALARRGPAMLGTDGPRRYLVAFTSPGEAHGQSGVLDGYAEITVTNGDIVEGESGGVDDLVAQLSAAPPTFLRALPDYFDLYGPLGAGSDTSPVSGEYWRSVTSDPDTPTVADVISQMFVASGHPAVDGVIIIDPFGLAAMLEVAGPVDITFGTPPVTEHVDAARLRQFLLVDQYALLDVDRQVVIEAVAGATLRAFLEASLPPPDDLGRVLGPVATEGHISWWTARPEEQEVIRLIGMASRLPAPNGRDGLAVVTNSVTGNETDAFIRRDVAYEATFDDDTHEVDGTITVTLESSVPATGVSADAVGNAIGLPPGTNRSILSIYSPLAVSAVSVDGVAVTTTTTASTAVAGWNITSVQVDTAPGQTHTVELDVSGTIMVDEYALVWRPQPLTTPDSFELAITTSDGVIAHTGELVRTSLIDADGVVAER